MVLDRSKYQGPTGLDQMSYGCFGQDRMVLKISRTFCCEPKILWIKCITVVLDRIKYQRTFGVDQMSYRSFRQDQMSANQHCIYSDLVGTRKKTKKQKLGIAYKLAQHEAEKLVSHALRNLTADGA